MKAASRTTSSRRLSVKSVRLSGPGSFDILPRDCRSFFLRPPNTGRTLGRPARIRDFRSHRCQTSAHPRQSFIRFKASVVTDKRTRTCRGSVAALANPGDPAVFPGVCYRTLRRVSSNPPWLMAEAHQSNFDPKRAYDEQISGDQSGLVGIIQLLRVSIYCSESGSCTDVLCVSG